MRKQFILFVLFVLGCFSGLLAQERLCQKATTATMPVFCDSRPNAVDNLLLGGVACDSLQKNSYLYSFTSTEPLVDIVVTHVGEQKAITQVIIMESPCNPGLQPVNVFCEEKEYQATSFQFISDDLKPLKDYMLLISSSAPIQKTCIQNFPLTGKPARDCADATLLCSKAPFSIQRLDYPEKKENELSGCIGDGFWYKWTCDKPGDLTFSITPVDLKDDIDFAVYEMGSIDDCPSSRHVRCMLAGEQPWIDDSRCRGKTGLQAGEDDTREPPGCPKRNNNWLQPLNMVAGRSYMLVVYNYSETTNGFSVEFGGAGTFLGPEVRLTIEPENINCDQEVTVLEQTKSNFGEIVRKNWYFSQGAVLKTDITKNPIILGFDRYGYHEIYLEVETSEGCISSIKDTIFVDECCKTTGLTANITGYQPPLCHGDSTGQIRLSAQGGTNQYGYQYKRDSGMLTRQSQFKGLKTGEYVFSVYDDKGCQVSVDTLLTEPERFSVRAQMDRSEVELGETASVTLQYEPDTTTLRKLLLQGEEWDCRFYNCYGFVDTPYIDQGYRITAISREGCKSEYTIPITVISNRKFGAPNAMSRTADREENRYFTLYSSKLTKGMDLKIFDRWGTLVFAGNSLPLNEPGKGWDGYYRGQPCPVGVYLYQAVVTFVDNKTELLAGEIHVLE